MNYHSGLYITNEQMKQYVEFICSLIKSECGADVPKSDGFPMNGCYIPVKFEILKKWSNFIECKITTLGFEKEFNIFMSRHKSPDLLLHEIQYKINDTTKLIISENKLDQDKIWMDHHPLRGLNKIKFKS